MKKGLHTLTRKCFYSLAIILAINTPSFSQTKSSGNYFEGGFTVGPMIFLGDLGGHFGKGTTFLKDYNVNATKISYGFFLAAHPSEVLGFRLSMNVGKVDGDDSYIKYKGGIEGARLARNLNFKSNILEGSLMAEIYPTALLEGDPSDVTGRLRPYGLIGLGVFHFNPMGTYVDPNTGQSTWVYLQPLHTEGEGFAADRPKNYKLTQLNVPIGVGIKYYFSEKLNIAFEVVERKTFTDYIDDVSTTFVDPALLYANLPSGQAQIADQLSNKSSLRGVPGSDYNPGDKRGDPTHTDAYLTAVFKVAFRLGSSNAWDNSTRCPLLRF